MKPKTKTTSTADTQAQAETPKTEEPTLADRVARLEAAFGPQLGIKLGNYDEEAVAVTADLGHETHDTRPLTDAERLTRLEVAAAAAGIKLYTKE